MSLLERLSLGRNRYAGGTDLVRPVDGSTADEAADYTCATAAGQMTKVIAAAKQKGASVIGVTGTAAGVGVSTISQQLAQTYAQFGKRVLLVDVSKVTSFPSDETAPGDKNATLEDYAMRISRNVGLVDLLGIPCGATNAHALQTMLRVAVDQGLIIVVDLPPVVQTNDQPSPSFSTVGAFCDTAFIVCPTGAVMANELTTCVEACRVVGVNLAGLILNDWQLLAGSLLSK